MEWERAWPVLEATYRLMRTNPESTGEDVFAELGDEVTEAEAQRAFRLLHDTGYLEVYFGAGGSLPHMFNATGPGLQETSGWPKPGAAGADRVGQLLAALDDRIESDETPEEEKGKLRRIREGVGDASRDIIVGVLTGYASRASGISD